MKILKYLFIVVLGLAVIFFAVGMLNPEVKYGHEIMVNKSVKEAWAITQDESKYSEWLAGFKSIELISGEKGKVGSKYKVLVNPGEGQEDFEMTETVISLEEFKFVEMSFASEMMDFGQIISFSETDGITTIKTDSKVIGKGMMMRSMFAIMEMISGSFQAQEVKNIEALKRVIEENTTDYYPAPEIIQDSTLVPAEGFEG